MKKKKLLAVESVLNISLYLPVQRGMLLRLVLLALTLVISDPLEGVDGLEDDGVEADGVDGVVG